MIPHEINSMNLFVMGWYAEDTTFCDELIEYHNRPETKKGEGGFGGGDIDHDVKHSIDSCYSKDMMREFRYSSVLKNCLDLYNQKFEASSARFGYSLQEGFNIQHYPVGGGYKKFHCERNYAEFPNVGRHLVFMTYLNDVRDGGGTEFYYQGVTIRADKGLTLVWPADWTYTHRGVVSPSEEKWIITGWLGLNDESNIK